MAFATAANYNNLPNGVFSPTIYSKKVQIAFRKKAVAEDITNNQYFGEIRDHGDSVRILKEPEIQIFDIARGSQITPQDMLDSDFTLIVDRAKAYAFRIDDIEKKQAHVDWMAMAANRAAYVMKDDYDRDVLGYIAGYEYTRATGLWAARTTAVGTKAWDAADSDELLAAHKLTRATVGGSSSESIAVGTKGTYDMTPLELLGRMSRILDEKNVDTDGRWVVINPAFKEKLMHEDSKLINGDYNPGANQLTNGRLQEMKIRGFRVYESQNLPEVGTGSGTVDTNGSSSNYGVLIAGHDSAAATAQQLSKVEKLRDQFAFSDIVRGMHVYGRKILRPESLVRAWWNVNA